jgi:epoxyqueuosine reductase
MDANHMNSKIKEIAEKWGADFFGAADLSPAHDAILSQGGPDIAGYPRAVSIGIGLMDSIVDRLPQRADGEVALSYRHHGYEVINQRLDLVISNISSMIQRKGYRALPIAASKRVKDERICADFSHKLAAHLAGLGWIGKSCLLVTPERGPRVRWATVLTDAPLQTARMTVKERCGTCNKCVEICPAHAFTGEPFRLTEPREKRYDASKCDGYFNEMRAENPEKAVCGLCVYICPHGGLHPRH